MVAIYIMSIDAQLYLLTGGLSIIIGFAAYQAYTLKNLYKSKSSALGAFIFILLGARQVYSLLRLHHNIADARANGVMIDHLTLEQWLVGVVWAYLIAFGFTIWLHWQRNDLRKLGI